MQEPGIGVYRPNDNPLIDWLQTWGRLRSNKSMLDRKDLKGMIKALKKAKWSGTHRIMITARAQAFSSRYLPLSRLRPRRNLDAGTDVRRMSGALRSTP